MTIKQPKSSFSRGVFATALAATIIVCAFALWLFTLDSTRGLLEWMPSYRKTFMYLLIPALLPILLLVSARFSRIMGIVSLAISIIILVAITASFGVLFMQTRKLPAQIPQMNLLDISAKKPLVHLAFSSDPHFGSGKNNPDVTEAMLRTINAEKFDAFFVLGDIAEMGMPGTDFDVAASLFSKEIPDVPISTVIGNHDALIGGAYRYRAFFNPRMYYRIDSGTTHILALNLLWGTESFGGAQKKWLVETLASIPKTDTTIVLSHCFFFASGYTEKATGKDWFDHKDTIKDIVPILENGGVDLVISGHNHFMEYIDRPATADASGTAYVIIGSMGGLPDQQRTYTTKDSKWYLANQFGFLDLAIRDNRMELTFRDETGKTLHTVVR